VKPEVRNLKPEVRNLKPGDCKRSKPEEAGNSQSEENEPYRQAQIGSRNSQSEAKAPHRQTQMGAEGHR
jgi:hypothetical protein